MSQMMSMPVGSLCLTTRTANLLRAAGLETVGKLTAMTAAKLLTVRKIGRKSLKEIQEQLAQRGMRLRNDN
jgi:DNA-directed RNA polymerase subunit alpha